MSRYLAASCRWTDDPSARSRAGSCKHAVGAMAAVFLLVMNTQGGAQVALPPDGDIVGDGALASPENGGLRRWRVSAGDPVALRDDPDAGAPPLATLESDQILTSHGCLRVEAGIWCEVQGITGGPRGFVPAEHLAPVAGPDGIVARGIDDSSRRARRGDFDVSGEIACAQDRHLPMADCTADVARSSGGDATVVATFPNGFRRRLHFGHGMFLRGDATMSGVGTDTAWRLEGGMHFIRVDDQRFEIPDAMIVAR
ncbi:MAG: hypothetical protein ACU0B9_20035 [Limimaricola soesokkakensis]